MPLVPQAVGTGIMWPGMNNGEFSNNYVFDNWQHGTFLIGIPDAIAGTAEGNVDPDNHCGAPASGIYSTSCANEYHDNVMGVVPDGFKKHPGITKFGNGSGLDPENARRAPTTPTTRRANSRTASISGGTRRRPRSTTAGPTTRAMTARGIR